MALCTALMGLVAPQFVALAERGAEASWFLCTALVRPDAAHLVWPPQRHGDCLNFYRAAGRFVGRRGSMCFSPSRSRPKVERSTPLGGRASLWLALGIVLGKTGIRT
jgi:hypothetical protein